jgi:hypothetical protein
MKVLAVPGILGVVAYLASRPSGDGRWRREAALLLAALPAFCLITITLYPMVPQEAAEWLMESLFFAVLTACLLPIQYSLGRRAGQAAALAPHLVLRVIVGALLLALLYHIRSG